MKKAVLLLITISSFHYFSVAQCPPFPAADGCGLAVPICEGIDGYCNTLSIQDQPTEVLPGCDGSAVINNDDWIAFYASSTTIIIVITPDSCQSAGGNQGLQAGLYAACDAGGGQNGDGQASDTVIVQCDCTTDPITFHYTDFVIGQIYYLVIDGCGGDICNYGIEVLEGSTANEEITEQIGNIQGDTSLCMGNITTFSIDPVENATFYNWIVDSTASIVHGQGTTEIEVEIMAEGNIEICVSANNACFNGEESCLTISSMGTIQTSTIVEAFCAGDSIEFEGEFYTDSGFYSAVYEGINGCDSILNLDLTVYEVYDINIYATICEGDSFEFGDSVYSESGFYENSFITSNGCDSIISLNLEVAMEYFTMFQDSTCDNIPYIFEGSEYLVGQYEIIFETVDGCDSIFILIINGLPTYQTTIDTLLPSGGSYNGIFYDNDTTLFENNLTENGCDSLLIINIMLVTDVITLPSGIDQLNLFPIPASNQFFFQLELSETIELKIEVYNTLGKRVNNLSLQSLFTVGHHTVELDGSQLSNGAYFLHFQTEKGNFEKRLVIAR